MPTFFARRYFRPVAAVSRTEQAVGAFILLLLAVIFGGMAWHVRSDRDDPFAPVLVGEPARAWQFPELPGWQPPEAAEHYASDELYLKINGRAEFYLQHQVTGLVFGTYTHVLNPDRTIDVYCYTMRTAEAARAAYEAEKPADGIALDSDATGYTSAGAVFACVAAHYLQVLPAREAAEDAAAARDLMVRLSAAVLNGCARMGGACPSRERKLADILATARAVGSDLRGRIAHGALGLGQP